LRMIVHTHRELALEKRAAFMVGFNRRFAPMVVQLRSFLAEIPEPLALNYRVNAGYLSPEHWLNDREQGGGRILGEACHFVDLLMFLAASPIVEVEARVVANSGRYSGDNVLASLRFANGSEGSISYLANGDRSFSKERIEVFGGGAVAVLEDFRRLQLIRDGHKQTVHSRWRQDKGHRGEWAAFAKYLQRLGEIPIRFEDLICSTLATLRIDEAVATGRRIAVDVKSFLNQASGTSILGSEPDTSSRE